ncbi:hypothetical protein GBA52_010608, partial [Prunus armeniaca]
SKCSTRALPWQQFHLQRTKPSPSKAWDPLAQASPQAKMDWAVARRLLTST